MYKAVTLSVIVALAGSANAQLSVLSQSFWASAVNDDGLVAGYLVGSPVYHLWNPDLSSTENIGGITPAGGAGGQIKFAADGQRLCGGAAGAVGSEMATYDRSTNTWTPHGDLGVQLDNNASSAWNISADGNTVVGLAWVPGGTAHGVAYNPTEGIIDLGTLHPGSSTRANAANGDGSTVVGWQDLNGPWKAAVWRKDPAGGYLPNTYILINPTGSASDENNQAGECSAISDDGSVIGGYGDFATNDEPWIWTQAGGVQQLGVLPAMGRGFVADMSADGSRAVGWFDGQFFGDPRKAFLWTAQDGLQDLNTYATDVLGITLGNNTLGTANSISPDGRYICGVGQASSSMVAYRLDLGNTTGIQNTTVVEDLEVWPNPTTDRVRFYAPQFAHLDLFAADGRCMQRMNVVGATSVDLSNFDHGMYTMVLRTNEHSQVVRILKR